MEVSVTTRKLFAVLVLAIAVFAPQVLAGPFLVPGARCVIGALTAPNTVSIDPNTTTLTVGSSNPKAFSFTTPVIVWVTPLTTVGRGMLIPAITLCGPTGAAIAGLPRAAQPCRVNTFGLSVSMTIPGPEGTLLLQRGL